MKSFTQRQIEIIEAATERIDKHGIQNLTIKNLAADIGLSEPALYRHFKSKNEILLGLLTYFISEMKTRLVQIIDTPHESVADELRDIFISQLQTFVKKPAIISVIFSESIFHFDKALSEKVNEIMSLMQEYILTNIKKGHQKNNYTKTINASTITTIIIGSMRLTVLKWKLSGHRSNLVKDGKAVLDGIIHMIEKK